ncbi:MAG TPA: S8 family serine peptidase [Roseiflexaceae bacterium]|nr:S8 family serine peptidase [Roseiflexaceae bacterium]HMP40084.1 S8 family serine peptidase [Roseiflexaceae bacterium]
MQQASTPAGYTPQGCLTPALLLGALWWIGIVVTLAVTSSWGITQARIIGGDAEAGWDFVIGRLVVALLLAIVIGPLALFGSGLPRVFGRLWGIGLLIMLPGSLLGNFPLSWGQPLALAQLAICTAALAIIRVRRQRQGIARDQVPLAPAVALGVLPLLPLLRYGAFGSPIDTLLAVAAGFSLALLAAELIDLWLIPALHASTLAIHMRVLVGGIAAAALLLILAAGIGVGGSAMLLALSWPPLGIVAVALAQPRAPSSTTLLLGPVAAAIAACFDGDELVLVLGFEDIPRWALQAAGFSFLIGMLLAVAAVVLATRIQRLPRSRIAAALAGVAWVGATLIYTLGGQPGFYGDRMFVVLRHGAALPPLSGSHAERTAAVYQELTRHAEETQSGVRSLLNLLGVRYQPYYLVNGIEVDGGPFIRLLLTLHPDVDRVLDSPRLRPVPYEAQPAPGDTAVPDAPDWNLTSIGVDRVWRELEVYGSGIVVGLADSGVDATHPALAGGYRGRHTGHDYNWLDPWSHQLAPRDLSGHGSHTLGLAVGRHAIGVAPSASWFACANLERNLANPALYLDCMQFMLAPYPLGGDALRDGDPAQAAHIINNSWGCPPLEGCDADVLRPATEALRAAGIFVVVAAGNEGPHCGSVRTPLALYDAAYSVGAIDDQGDLADFSSRGPVEIDGSGRIKPDIVAPGVMVLSAIPGGGYARNSGTSMAAPHIAGVVALMWSANADLIGDIDRTEAILAATARPYSGIQEPCFAGSAPSIAYGYGVIDAYAAVEAAIAPENEVQNN